MGGGARSGVDDRNGPAVRRRRSGLLAFEPRLQDGATGEVRQGACLGADYFACANAWTAGDARPFASSEFDRASRPTRLRALAGFLAEQRAPRVRAAASALGVRVEAAAYPAGSREGA